MKKIQNLKSVTYGLVAVVAAFAAPGHAQVTETPRLEPKVIQIPPPPPAATPVPTPPPRPSYKQSIVRRFANRTQAEMIHRAENYYPPRAAVQKAAGRTGRQAKALAQATAKAQKLWWYDDFDGTRIPYAITAEAVGYYQTLLGQLRAGDFRQTHGIRMFVASFDYRAEVAYHPRWTSGKHQFKSVYVVQLKLKWEQVCGNLCALWIDRTRTVVLDAKGNVLDVAGDGPQSVIVS